MKTWRNLRLASWTSFGPLSTTPKRGSISSRLQTHKHGHTTHLVFAVFLPVPWNNFFPNPLQLIEHFPRWIRTQVWQNPTGTYGRLPPTAGPDDFSPRPFTGTSRNISKEHSLCYFSYRWFNFVPQTVSWLRACPSLLEECIHSVLVPKQIKTLLERHRANGNLQDNGRSFYVKQCHIYVKDSIRCICIMWIQETTLTVSGSCICVCSCKSNGFCSQNDNRTVSPMKPELQRDSFIKVTVTKLWKCNKKCNKALHFNIYVFCPTTFN